MSYPASTSAWTRKQANVLFAAFKRGDLQPPKRKKEGFVYNWVGARRMVGFYLKDEDKRHNDAISKLNKCLQLYFEGCIEAAQRELDEW